MLMQLFQRLSLACVSVLCLCTISTQAADLDADEKAQLIGTPTEIVVQPQAITLSGPLSWRQIVVTGKYKDGTQRDLTVAVKVTPKSEIAMVQGHGLIRPLKNGGTSLTIQAGTLTHEIPVTVTGMDKPEPVSFRHDLVGALNVGGCNSGACHGTPSGKNGFRLSLRGYDPAADYIQLTRDVHGRRTDRLHPEMSLIYQKALAKVPHEGGQRFQAKEIPAQMMKAWLSQGLQNDSPKLANVDRIEILPGSRVANAPARWQQLAVLAHLSDGKVRDVTQLTVFSSSDEAVAGVNKSGLVEFYEAGEVAILCRYLDQMETVRLTYLEPREGFVWNNPPENNYVDKHVFAKLKLLSIPTSNLCTDQEFLRRAYLDLCGILPTPKEVKAFMESTDENKRAKLIDELLERPEYADYWTLKWTDVLRNNRKHVQYKGAIAFQKWVRNHVAANNGFDKMVQELLTANGSTFANPPANYYRIAKTPQDLAETTAQLFFGIRMQCAKCHNHPFERWTQDDYYSLAAFFARVQRKVDPLQPGSNPKKKDGAEIIFSARSGEVTQPRSGQRMAPKVMGLKAPEIPDGKSRRDVLADVVTSPENKYFAKSIVNRIWYHLNGKGIVDPVDDFRESNPSANDELLDALTADFVKSGHDVKHLIRVIMSSRTYQLSAQTNSLNREDEKYFSHATTKLMSAEPLLDAICQVTGIGEKFSGMPTGTRAVQLPDGEYNHPFLKTFGQPARELACECERQSDSNLAQALQLINGPTVNGKLRSASNVIGEMLKKKMPEADMLDELYLKTLSRLPNEGESKVNLTHVQNAQDKRKAWEDVLWALINSKEFLFRH